jgi:puromycin-sensitive aminopeptidase
LGHFRPKEEKEYNKIHMKKNTKKNVRLSPTVRPSHYNLTLHPDLQTFTYSGKEEISIQILKSTKTIILHSKELHVSNCHIQNGKKVVYAKNISYDTQSETVIFAFTESIPVGKTKLVLSFEGKISDTLRGFYKSSYVIDGETKYIATTQFEPTDARRAFPCFDEPEHKAIFDVSLVVHEKHTAISNTLPTEISEHSAGYNIIRFAPTPIMSTYLLAFIIGEFEYIEGITKDKVKVRIFTTKGKKQQATFALDVAIKSLEFYNEYFDIDYPLPILDLIAIPDFESAAMENWGAVTFRETALLFDEENSSFSNKQWAAIVIAHEIAHQWFGNLVTMSWWTDLWLNEGFASYMENLCIDHIFPQWHIWDLYLADRYAVALRLDSLRNSHPIEVTVHHPDEINEIFDMVSYAKGAAVMRQLAMYLGHDTFRDGLRHYLKKYSYKNTETVNLWQSFEKVSKKPVTQIMKSWTQKTGYPLVTISKKKNQYTATQERFFMSRISREQASDKTLWQVPYTYESLPADATPQALQAGNSEVLHTLQSKKTVPLIGISIGKVNLGEGSFIRVRYDNDTLAKLKEEILSKKLSVRDRLAVIRDVFALAEGGYIDTTVALDFSLSYKHETEYIVWSELADGINRVYNISYNEIYKDAYRSYARSLFSPLAARMTWEKIPGEQESATFLRSLALSCAALYGDEQVIKKAKSLFAKRNAQMIRADIRGLVYTIVSRNGGTKEWDIFAKLYKTEEMHEEKDRYGRALTQFTDKTLLARTLTFALSEHVRAQDGPFMIGGVWGNQQGRELAWQFVQHNWNTMLARYGEGGHFLSRVLSPLGSHTAKKDAQKAEKFFKTHVAPGCDRILAQSYERIYSNDIWRKTDKGIIKKWLDKNFKK